MEAPERQRLKSPVWSQHGILCPALDRCSVILVGWLAEGWASFFWPNPSYTCFTLNITTVIIFQSIAPPCFVWTELEIGGHPRHGLLFHTNKSPSCWCFSPKVLWFGCLLFIPVTTAWAMASLLPLSALAVFTLASVFLSCDTTPLASSLSYMKFCLLLACSVVSDFLQPLGL